MEKVILKIETTCNTSDKVLLQNLRDTKERGLTLAPFITERVDRPLFICGSGPSLLKYYRAASKLFPDHDVMALNGAYKALQSIGVTAKFYAQLDARAVNVNFVENPSTATKFLLSSQCAPEMFNVLQAHDVAVFHLNTPTTRKIFPDEKVYFGGGTTIGSTAMALAATLGYRNLGLFGYDSSYSCGHSHAVDQPQNNGQTTLDVWIDERKYISTPNMAKQVEDFRPWCSVLEKVFPDIVVSLFGEGLLYDYILSGQKGQKTRESEAAKYAECYKDPSYRMPPHRAKAIKEILADRQPGSLLDVGTGRGETLSIASELGYTVISGTETVDYLLNERVGYGLLPNLPTPSAYYETVTCFEVIEHLLPKDVNAALVELKRVAKDRVIISAATRSDIRGGVELHPSYRSESEWMETFKAVWGVEADIKMIGNLSSCGLSPVYEYRLRS
jgi:hypothetical protein